MNTQVAPVSEQIKEAIARRIGPQRYKVWFKNATHFTITENSLRVGIPNQFIGGWIERHFSETILDAAREVLGREPQLTYLLDARLGRNLRKTQLNSQAACVARGADSSPRHLGGRSAPPAPVLRGRLEEFVIGPSNRAAYNAALDLAELRPNAASPLFLHGACGLGKTHLLQGIGNALAEQRIDGRAVRWAYVAGEEFTNQFLLALKARDLDAFRRRYRDLDVLLLDDVHFLANKKATQEEFLHTFNAIDMVGKRVALASDAHPRMIGQISEALVSRFVAGVVLRIEPPDHATRCGIVRSRAARLGLDGDGRGLPDDVVSYIADCITSNVRELEGALLRVVAFASMSAQPLSLRIARQSLDEHASRTERLLTAEQIESAVATFFGMNPADLHTSRKTRGIALARSIAMHLARKHTRLSFPEIGRAMGNKNHSTVLLACRRIDDVLAADGKVTWQNVTGTVEGSLRELVEQLEQQLGLEPTVNPEHAPVGRGALHARTPAADRLIPTGTAAEDSNRLEVVLPRA